MLTKGDDYPIHQLPEPIAYSGTDRNFYERYFFNGYCGEKHEFFALSFGIYPHLNIMDSSFCVTLNGVQHNLRTSRHMGMERLDTHIGPISLEVIEPLKKLRIKVDDEENEIFADITFTARAAALEEPRQTLKVGPRTMMDYTRMTQNGCYYGFVKIKGSKIILEPDIWMGTRDRSWGVRPIGASDPQEMVPPQIPQYFWLWAPANFDDSIVLYYIGADEEGYATHSHALIMNLSDDTPCVIKEASHTISFIKGTRHAESAELLFKPLNKEDIKIQIKPLFNFYMSGLGYLHPEWGHGCNKGELAVHYDTYDLECIDPADFLFLHIEAVCEFIMGDKKGMGVLEQLIIGPHKPSGFKDFLDMTE